MNENGNGRVLMVLAPGFEEMEALTPVDILRRAGLKVVLAGVGSKTITGGHGITVVCDIEIETAGTDFNAIVLPGGGQGSKNLAASWAVNEKLLLIANSGAIVASICAAPAVVLWPTGLLEGRKAVCYPGVEINCPGYTFGNERVCVDGNLITSRAAGCAVEFALMIVEKLAGMDERNAIAKSILFQG